MDFGVVGLEGLVSPNCPGAQGSSDAKPKGIGSGFLKQERSGSEEDEWRALKMAKIDDFSTSKTMPLHQSNPRSNALLSADHNRSPQEQMLSFSSLKSEASFICKDGVLMERATQDGAFPYLHSGYGTAAGSLGSSNKNGHFGGIRGPFTPFQWSELQHQALIYKYLTANVPVPSNLLIPIKRSFNAYGLSYPSNSFGWGSFHLGFSGNTDPEPGRCRRTDGKKWRCSRDAVADQKYCERHMNRGRHRSRKPVEGQAAAATNTMAKLMPAGGVSSSAASLAVAQQQQLKNLQPPASSNDRMYMNKEDSKSKDNPFMFPKQQNPFEESSRTEFGLVPSDSLLNPSNKSSTLMDYKSFSSSHDRDSEAQHSLRQFMDDWPKSQSDRAAVPWPELDMQSDRTQLSISIPVAPSGFPSSPSNEKVTLSPLRLSREFDPIQMGLGVGSALNETSNRQANWIPISWETSMGGPLGEVLHNTNNSTMDCKTSSSALNLMTEGWDNSPRLGSSPTGVLQKTAFGSLSNSSAGSSPRAHESGNLCNDLLGTTTLVNSTLSDRY